MNISKNNKRALGKRKLDTTLELDFDEAVFLGSKLYSEFLKQNSSRCKHKGVQDHNDYTLDVCENCLEKIGIKYGRIYCVRSNREETAMVKQKKIALKTFDVIRCYIDRFNSVPWDYNPPSRKT